MPVSAKTLALLMQAGLQGEALLAVVASMDDDMATHSAAPKPVDSAAENRRAWDRDRKRQIKEGTWKKGGKKVEIPHGNPPDQPKKESSPTPPKEKTTPLSQTPSASETAPAGKPASKRGTRLPADWQPSDKNRADALEAGCPENMIQRMGNGFRDYWVAKPGKDGVKLDWDATWRNWARREAERRGWAPELQQDRPTGQQDDGRFYAKQDTPEFEAWRLHTGKSMTDTKGGWFFPSRWPPGHAKKAPAEEPTPSEGMF